MGLGYLYNGQRKLLGLLLTLGAFGMTYLEQIHVFPDGNTLQTLDSTAFIIMFICILTINSGLAFDAYNEANKINEQ